MEYYSKGKNVEESFEKEKIPINNLPHDFTWMQVRGGSKIRNLLSYALKELSDTKPVLWTGYGPAIGKTVTCAEIMKRECKHALHQITKICYYVIDEYWYPKISELDPIVVNKKLPMIHILLSFIPINTDDLSYQAPGLKVSYHLKDKQNNTPTKSFSERETPQRKHNNRRKNNSSKKQKDQKSQ
ncbi:ribonuclease P protein subunit p25-like protein [Agrilus planipennis]|uniref:Ribonuclease P protein subunit p25-like protein n=1 Tax=Agrilus planipennis TaxID=224129 RepID=A0A1W4XU27_AGRPL|nr:ribonuclease P protein subunit p25-like protein [Agrilus planipennis]